MAFARGEAQRDLSTREYVDGQQVAVARVESSRVGQVGLASAFHGMDFDNLVVREGPDANQRKTTLDLA